MRFRFNQLVDSTDTIKDVQHPLAIVVRGHVDGTAPERALIQTERAEPVPSNSSISSA